MTCAANDCCPGACVLAAIDYCAENVMQWQSAIKVHWWRSSYALNGVASEHRVNQVLLPSPQQLLSIASCHAFVLQLGSQAHQEPCTAYTHCSELPKILHQCQDVKLSCISTTPGMPKMTALHQKSIVCVENMEGWLCPGRYSIDCR